MSQCECGSFVPHTGHCGCCGVEISGDYWCERCRDHLGPGHLPPWDRTYFGQHGVHCPFDVVDGSTEGAK